MKMSKRTGKAVTMRDLIEEVGLDAVRYFFAMRSADTHMDIHVRISAAHREEITDRVKADLFNQVAHRYGFPRTFAHLHFFAVFV